VPGLTARDREPRVEATDLLVEGAPPLPHGRREVLAQGEETRFELLPRALRAAVGALARGTRIFEPFGLRPQALLPLEEGGVLPSVLPYRRRRLRDERRVLRGLFPSKSQHPAKRAPGNARKGP